MGSSDAAGRGRRWLGIHTHPSSAMPQPLTTSSRGEGSRAIGGRPRSTNVVIVALGLMALVVALVALSQTRLPTQRETLLAVIFVGLQITAVACPLPLARRQFLSLYTAVIFAATLLLDPALAMLIGGLGTLVAERLRHQPTQQVVFNTVHVALQAGAAGLLVARAYGGDVLAFQRLSAIVVVLAAALVMYASDVLMVALIVAAQEGLAFASVALRTL